MRTAPILASILIISALAGTLAAQTTSTTLPKGWDSKEGTDTYSPFANSSFWCNFDLGPTTTKTYNPAKGIYMYDSSTFPWNKANTHVITRISFRRDGPSHPAASTAHTRKWVVIMSTASHPPAQANFNNFSANHGANRTVVFGKVGTPKDVVFKKTSQPTSPKTAPFDVVVPFDTAFVVPPNAKTLCIEIRSYAVTGAPSGWWRVDSVRDSGTGYNGGRYSLINTDQCVAPSIFYTSRAMTIGSDFGHIWRPSQSPGGKQVLTWLGPKLTTPFTFPGTRCKVHVFPVLAIRFDTSEKSGSYAAYVDWGKIPLNAALVGASISHQSMFADPAYPGGAGLTRGGTSTVGTGYNPAVVKISAAYSFGANTTRYTGSTDPDKEIHPRYLYRRVPIVKIN
jgi:hypothetical protein